MENGGHHKMNGDSKGPMELYIIRISPPCRAVWLYMLQHEIPHILHDVDFSKNAMLPEVFKNQPHQEVPLLVDGEITVFDGAAILRYLAMKYTNYAGFGLSLQQQMMSESVISWCFSEIHRVIGYAYIYPQFLDHYSLKTPEANEIMVEHALQEVTKLLEIMRVGKTFSGTPGLAILFNENSGKATSGTREPAFYFLGCGIGSFYHPGKWDYKNILTGIRDGTPSSPPSIIESRYLVNNRYLTGTRLTTADSCVAAVIVLLEWTNFNFKMWPKLEHWLDRVKQNHFWEEAHVSHNQFVKDVQRSSMILD